MISENINYLLSEHNLVMMEHTHIHTRALEHYPHASIYVRTHTYKMDLLVDINIIYIYICGIEIFIHTYSTGLGRHIFANNFA